MMDDGRDQQRAARLLEPILPDGIFVQLANDVQK